MDIQKVVLKKILVLLKYSIKLILSKLVVYIFSHYFIKLNILFR